MEAICKITKNYIDNINSTHIKHRLNANVNCIVVVPTYNEELYIEPLLESLCHQTYEGFEVIIVDNGSTDNTLKICNAFKKKAKYTLNTITELKPGPGNARKRGMDEAIWRFHSRDNEFYKHINIILTTDADAIAHPNWIFEIEAAFVNINVGGIAGKHIAKPYIDQKIYSVLGISNYFLDIEKLIDFLRINEIGKPKMSGPNCAFLANAYIAAGGIYQPYIDGKIAIKEIKNLQDRIELNNYQIKAVAATIYASQRRHLFELLQGGEHQAYSTERNGPRFVTIRSLENELLSNALKNVSKLIWREYRNKIVRSIINNTVFEPIRNKKYTYEKLKSCITIKSTDLLNETEIENVILKAAGVSRLS